ncbi:centrosomal protein of 41 kDa isoform X2 [Cynoglossus semilaevis]|uniref:centrosomal protein of 41 kDa isoform X2 n=1 Tax=Cynoglossus semilaevis TaxID=244447 RepID=UPI0004983E0E|nr:centrosomal protein of 41 kDa isoform X2 [Cynoglossus semilaevis]
MLIPFKKMSYNRSIGSVKYMEKRIPKNPKYQHVKTKLDTGCSLTNYMEDIQTNYRYHKDEIFKRLGVTTFAQMILQVAAVSELNEIENDNGSHDTEDTDLDCQSHRQYDHDNSDVCHTARSTLLSVISGMGELSRENKVPGPVVPDGPYADCPYLLLDVRDRDLYDSCHIISAHSFPSSLLSRTMDAYTKEVREYRNAAGKIIILYDEDERIAAQTATSMCQRGFENLFILSGGLKVLCKKFPDGMVTGSIPTSCLAVPPSSKSKKSSIQQHQLQQTPAAVKRWRFTSDELSRIQEQLEDSLVPSRLSSRMSTTSSRSRVSSAGSRQSSSTVDRESRVQSSTPWK